MVTFVAYCAQMYKVFYNEKLILLTDKPSPKIKSLKYITDSQFEEALAILKITSASEINIYYHNLDKLWQHFKAYFHYLEAAGGVVTNPQNQLLFIYRLMKWDLPKGKVEKGETTEIAAIREVEEECGMRNLELGRLITKTYHIYFQKDMILKATYWYAMKVHKDETPVPQHEEGIDIAKWIDKSDLHEILDNTYGNIKIVLENC